MAAIRSRVRSAMPLLAAALAAQPAAAEIDDGPARPNVLLIVVDDLNTDIRAYGHEHMVTPNLDRLAAMGVLFERCYAQQAVCAASRASFLTGLRPETAGADYPYSAYFVNHVLPTYGTMSRFFGQHGYVTRHFGKVHHGDDNALEDLSSPWFPGRAPRYFAPANTTWEHPSERTPFEASPTNLGPHGDTLVARELLTALEESSTSDEPFFYIAGFRKPHLPFVAPEAFFDLYDVDALPLPVNPVHPEGAPKWTINRYVLQQYAWEHRERGRPFSDEYTRRVRRAYYACVSYVDHLIGTVVGQVDQLGLLDNTVVVITSDHGYHLGDQAHWAKTSNYERSVHVPLIVLGGVVPGRPARSRALVELVDVFPTLAELCRLPAPDHLEGTSLVPLLSEPNRPWKSAAFSRQPWGLFDRVGHAIRTDRYRYVEWTDTKSGDRLLQELYDYQLDPHETRSLADSPEHRDVLRDLEAQLAAGWKNALPPGVEDPAMNPPAPIPFAFGDEGVSRREQWVERYGGTADMDWQEAARRRELATPEAD